MLHMKRRKYIADLLVLLFGVFILLIIPSEINSVPGNTTGPRFFPYVLGSAIILLSAVQFVLSLLQKESGNAQTEEAEEKDKFSYIRVTLVIGCAFLWMVTIPILGVTIPTFTVAILSMWILGERRLFQMISTSMILAIIIYIVFVIILDVRFPSGLFY